jgi:hypothetical protein
MPFDCMPPNRACRRFESEDIAKQGSAWDIVERFRTNLAEALNGGALGHDLIKGIPESARE